MEPLDSLFFDSPLAADFPCFELARLNPAGDRQTSDAKVLGGFVDRQGVGHKGFDCFKMVHGISFAGCAPAGVVC